MTELSRERCTACRRDSPSVSPEEIAALHPQTPEWQLIDGETIPKLNRVFRFTISRRPSTSQTALANWRRKRGTIPA